MDPSLSPFNALLARMKYITRWQLMRASRAESLSEHTADTALLAHTLCLLATQVFRTQVRPETVTVAALYHDAGEVLTGDMPTPVKYKTEPLRKAYKALEADTAHTLCTMLPRPLQTPLRGYLTGQLLTKKERQLLKAADRLSALLKCIDEEQAGNREFAGAKAQQLAALKAMECPEVDYFLEHMLPCYYMTLDELSDPKALREKDAPL
jgi:5'-deoxynucleotidase